MRTRSRVLARASATKSIDLERTGGTGKLRMSLQVHADPQGHRTRLGYYADLFFTRDEQGQNSEAGQEEQHIGYISSWRLSKEPNSYGHEDPQPWVAEWLRGDLGDPQDDSRPFKQTLRLLYNWIGQPQAVDDDSLRSALADTGHELIFIEMIWIKYKDETTGFQVSSGTCINPQKTTRLISRGPVLSSAHCATRLGTALLTHEQRHPASVVHY